MTASFHLPFIFHLAFTNEKLLIGNLLKIENCKLEIERRRCV